MRTKLLLVIILVLAAILRFWQLDQLPPALNWDEVSIGFNAYSVLKTGRDEWGQFLPLTFRIYGDYKLPAYLYLSLPFVAILGLNEWAVRLPSAILGVALVYLIFLLVKELTKEKTALWAAFIASILPWAIILSRIALEAQLSLVLTTLGVYLFIKGIKKKAFLLLSATVFGLTIFSYNSSRIVTPLLIFSLGLIYRLELTRYKKIAVASLALFLIFFIVALPKALLQDSSARYKWTTILDIGAINKINELRGSSALPPTLSQITYNKVTYLVPEAAKNYLSHFHPNFLFINGGSNYQFSIPGSGLFYPILAPFALMGIVKIMSDRKRWQLIVVGWLLIAILPAAITRDAPHALRSLTAIPPFLIIIALGIQCCFNDLNYWIRRKNKIFNLALVTILLISLFLFWQNYTDNYRKNYSWSWQYGYKQTAQFIEQEGDKYNKIYFTKKYGEPHEFLLFYLKINPQKYFTDPNLVRFNRSDWYWVDRFSKYYFLNDWEVKQNAKCPPDENCLLITSLANFDQGKLLQRINFLNGDPAFDIVEL